MRGQLSHKAHTCLVRLLSATPKQLPRANARAPKARGRCQGTPTELAWTALNAGHAAQRLPKPVTRRQSPTSGLRGLACAAGSSQTAWPADMGTAQRCPPSAPSLSELASHVDQLSEKPTVAALSPLVIVISGPSGVGKDAVIKQLEAECPDLHFVVTATSRGRREGEVDGVDYLFVSKEQFEQWVAEDALLEHALVYGEYKGIPRDQVEAALAKGTDVVLRLDVQGAATVRRLLPDCVSIFLVANNERELAQRLIARKTEPLDSMLVRLSTARQEVAAVNEFDYVVVNRENELNQTVQDIMTIMQAEKFRVRRRVQP